MKVSWRESFSDARPLIETRPGAHGRRADDSRHPVLFEGICCPVSGTERSRRLPGLDHLVLCLCGGDIECHVSRISIPACPQQPRTTVNAASLMNKQIEVGLLLAVPGILGIMTFAPFVISTLLFIQIHSRRRYIEMADPGRVASGCHVADGIHSSCERQRQIYFLDGVVCQQHPLDSCLARDYLLRFTRNRHGFFRNEPVVLRAHFLDCAVALQI